MTKKQHDQLMESIDNLERSFLAATARQGELLFKYIEANHKITQNILMDEKQRRAI